MRLRYVITKAHLVRKCCETTCFFQILHKHGLAVLIILRVELLLPAMSSFQHFLLRILLMWFYFTPKGTSEYKVKNIWDHCLFTKVCYDFILWLQKVSSVKNKIGPKSPAREIKWQKSSWCWSLCLCCWRWCWFNMGNV